LLKMNLELKSYRLRELVWENRSLKKNENTVRVAAHADDVVPMEQSFVGMDCIYVVNVLERSLKSLGSRSMSRRCWKLDTC
jgi:hypothetical protein